MNNKTFAEIEKMYLLNKHRNLDTNIKRQNRS